MRRWIAGLLGTFNLGNGVTMLVAPAFWASIVPGVAEHGPIPPHFVQDVGAAFLAAGLGLIARAVRPSWWPAAAAGTGFLLLHAGLHLAELAGGHAHAPVSDLALVVVPAALALWVSLPAEGPGLPTAFARWALDFTERRYDYDTTYMRAMLKESPSAFWKFSLIMGAASHRQAAPWEALFAAKLVGAVSEDCGPCTQLVVNMARDMRVPWDQLEAVLQRRTDTMTEATAAGFRFADAVVRKTEDEDEAREVVRRMWGDRGVIDLSLAIAIGRVFPMTKAGMGYARECRMIKLDGRIVPVEHAS